MVQPPNLTVGPRYSHPILVLPSLPVSLLGFLLLQGECDGGQEMGIKDHTKSGGFGEGMVSLVLLAPVEGVLRVEGALRHVQEARSTRLVGLGGMARMCGAMSEYSTAGDWLLGRRPRLLLS